MILAGDIGGTNSRLTLFNGTPSRLETVAIEIFPSREHSGLEEIAQKFLAKNNHAIDGACFGVAGAVLAGRVETTNLPWIVDSAGLARALRLDRVSLINDLEAN